MAILLIILFSFLLRLYKLDSLPGEMWGDVMEHYKMAQNILFGRFFLISVLVEMARFFLI